MPVGPINQRNNKRLGSRPPLLTRSGDQLGAATSTRPILRYRLPNLFLDASFVDRATRSRGTLGRIMELMGHRMYAEDQGDHELVADELQERKLTTKEIYREVNC